MEDLETVRRLVRAVVAALEAQRRRIDDLNVFPVPDGDTGTNLTLTVRAVRDALASSGAADRASTAADVVRAALLGARGNSGVILSQMVRGAADTLASVREVDAAAVAQALRGASDAAYAAVRAPVEGTMLTVVRELAEEAERRARDGPPLGELLHALVHAGEDSVARTRGQLAQLREAGVVDAGGAGVVELLRGLAAAVTGDALPGPEVGASDDIGAGALHGEPSRYRYCTTFVVEGEALDRAAIERALEPLGDSLLVVGDPSALKAHVHTDEPGAALTVGTTHGSISHVEVNDMQKQTAERTARLEATPAAGTPAATTAAVAVYSGEGNGRLLADAGAAVLVDGGETMNRSAGALLEAIERAAAPEVVVLPNDPNVVLPAERAAAEAGRPAVVVPTESIPEGLAGLVALDPARTAAENAELMAEAADGVLAGAVARASRDARLNGVAVREGEWVGLLGKDAVDAGPDLDTVAHAVIGRLLAEPRDVLTLLRGTDAPDVTGLVAEVTRLHPDVEIDVHDGGQAHYALLLSAE